MKTCSANNRIFHNSEENSNIGLENEGGKGEFSFIFF